MVTRGLNPGLNPGCDALSSCSLQRRLRPAEEPDCMSALGDSGEGSGGSTRESTDPDPWLWLQELLCSTIHDKGVRVERKSWVEGGCVTRLRAVGTVLMIRSKK